MQNHTDNGLFGTREAARFIGKSAPTLRKWRLGRKYLPVYKIGGSIRYRKVDLEKFIESGLELPVA